jgi:hypothetical protein
MQHRCFAPAVAIADACASALNDSDGSCDPAVVLKSLVEAVDALLQVT